MFNLRYVLVFFAGAEFFHTLSHILLPFFFTFPLNMSIMTLTMTLNVWAIIFNAAITIGLLWWASRIH